MSKRYSLLAAVFAISGGLVLGLAVSASAIDAKVHKFSAAMNRSDFAKRPDTDILSLSNGREISVGKIRNISAALKQLRHGAPGSRVPASFRLPIGAPAMSIRKPEDLKAGLKLKDSDSVTLKNGKTVPVGAIRFLQPYVERKTGKRVQDVKIRPNLEGKPARTVSSKAELKDLLKLPPDTVLESKNKKKRITVGMLKEAVSAGKITIPSEVKRSTPTTKPSAPAKTAPGKGVK